jgi:preprotein translocase subunit SecD
VKRNVWYLAVSVVLVVGTFIGVLASGTTPVLGLDLQGGFSVVLSPVGKFNSDSLDVARDLIEQRVNGLGVSEPEISRQGNDIVVDLPGVKDRAKAEAVIGKTAELRFRPVLADLPPVAKSTSTTTTTKPSGTTTPGETTVPPTTTTTLPVDDSAARAAVASCDSAAISALAEIPTTRRSDDKRKDCVALKTRDSKARLLLGPTVMTGKDVDDASKSFQSGVGSVVDMTLTDKGLAKFNNLASSAYSQTPPQNQVAIVLDSEVQSNPAFQSPTFDGDVQISGGFSADEADNLAKLIRYGALPVKLEQQTARSVSPTLGQDQLNAGVAAGLIGLALVAIYMLVFYRILGLVVILGLILSGMAIYSLVAILGETISLTLTLAGVTGIIVSVGVTVDSYIVYYERLKDEVRAGSTVRASVDRAFHRSFRTILAADLVSLLGALVLYLIAIGSVRGFAFYLGLSTILDLLVAYFFMHPLVSILARNPRLVAMPGIGINAGLDAHDVAPVRTKVGAEGAMP